MTLDELGRKYGTDKASGSHNYLVWYEKFFQPLRYKSITFVEIGVGSGSSLKTWRDYFPNAMIIGMDIDESVDKKNMEEERVRLSFGDQSSIDAMDKMLSRCNEAPTVINDDAGHDPNAQMFSFKYLMPKLTLGGLYVLEDIGSEDVVRFFSQLALRIVRNNPNEDGDEWIRAYGHLVETVSFYHESIVTKLRD